MKTLRYTLFIIWIEREWEREKKRKRTDDANPMKFAHQQKKNFNGQLIETEVALTWLLSIFRHYS